MPSQPSLRIERGDQRPVSARTLAWQHPDLAGKRGSVIVNDVVLHEAIRNVHHVNTAEFNAPSGRQDALKRTQISGRLRPTPILTWDDMYGVLCLNS